MHLHIFPCNWLLLRTSHQRLDLSRAFSPMVLVALLRLAQNSSLHCLNPITTSIISRTRLMTSTPQSTQQPYKSSTAVRVRPSSTSSRSTHPLVPSLYSPRSLSVLSPLSVSLPSSGLSSPMATSLPGSLLAISRKPSSSANHPTSSVSALPGPPL